MYTSVWSYWEPSAWFLLNAVFFVRNIVEHFFVLSFVLRCWLCKP